MLFSEFSISPSGSSLNLPMKWLVSSEIGFHTRDGKCRFTWFNSEMSLWVLLSRSGWVTSLRPISTNDSINDIWQLFENWSSAPPLSNVVLLGSLSFVKVSSNVVEEFCRDIALSLVRPIFYFEQASAKRPRSWSRPRSFCEALILKVALDLNLSFPYQWWHYEVFWLNGV